MSKVVINTSENYRYDRVLDCVNEIFKQLGGIESIVKPGMRVAIKPNLLTSKKPDAAATTHPAVVKAVITLVQQAGGIVTIVESPGGPFTTSMLKMVYANTGMEEVANETGAELNFDLRVEKVINEDAKFVKSLSILKPLKDADLIINIAKLKTHGMMVYTGAVKNMFGSIAGLEKANFHLRFSDYDQFAHSLIDIFLASKPQLNIIDGIIAMEGDGPGSGVPKYIGALIASEDAFACDYTALKIINVDYKKVPVMRLAEERGLLNKDDIEIMGANIEDISPESFEVPALKHIRESFRFSLLRVFGDNLRPRPKILHEKCISCGKCMQVCPPKAISPVESKRMIIDYKKCISCFCCHEFCPEHAIRIKKRFISRFLEYKKK